MFLLNFYYRNLIFWWRIFLIITLIFLFLGKSKGSFSSILNYFIIQEFLGFLFLFINFLLFQLFVLLLKIGVSPLHFWIYSIIYRLDGYILIWFLTFQKLPFISVLIYFRVSYLFILLIFGILLCYFQIFFLKNFKLIFLVSSTESFNWVLFGFIGGFFRLIIIFLYYFFRIIILIRYLNLSGGRFLGLETVIVFLNIPLRVTFFVKIFSLYIIFFIIDILIFLVLLMIFLSSLGIFYWFNSFRILNQNKFKDFYINFYFLIYFLFIIIIFYHFSKNNYIILIRWSSSWNDKTINRFYYVWLRFKKINVFCNLFYKEYLFLIQKEYLQNLFSLFKIWSWSG